MNRCMLTAISVLLVVTSVGLSHWGIGKGVSTTSSTLSTGEESALATPWSWGAVHPRISSAGDNVVFSYQGAIWRLSTSGGVMRRLTRGGGWDVEPAWSPDGERIAFLHGRDLLGGELHLLRANDGSPAPLPGETKFVTGKIEFHPDGKQLLGSFRLSGAQPIDGLAWLDLASGELRPVIEPPRPVRRPALSADGNWIAFATHLDVAGEQSGNDGPQADLWRVPSRGGQPEKITRFPSRIYDLCWSQQDRELIVVTDLGGANYDLWAVPLATPERPIQLTSGQADEDRPSMSRDGKLLYTDNRRGTTALVVRHLASGAESSVLADDADFGQAKGRLRLRVVDPDAHRSVVARVSIEEPAPESSGNLPSKFHAPPGSLYRIERSSGHFYCRQTTELDLPVGKYRLRAWRGPEYRATSAEFTIDAGTTKELELSLRRWEKFADSQYFSGENHIHANYGYGEWYNTPLSMLDQCEGEDLNVCNFMVANSDGDGVFDRQFFRGRLDSLSGPETILYWNEEFRSTMWGHMTLVNLRQLVEPIFTGFRDTTNPWDIPTNSDIADRAHLGRGLVNYTHAAQNAADPYLGAYTAKGVPVDVALGKIDTMDLNNSYDGTVPLWYRLLNCGFRLPASAGTDCFLNRIRSRLPGSDRVYVRLENGFSYENWIEGLRAGRSFVGNGPIVELEVDGQGPGETIGLPDARQVRIVGRARSQLPIHRVELIYNGQVVADAQGADAKGEVVIDRSMRLERSGWLALLASGPPHADLPSGRLYAHTSPVYVRVAGQPAGSPTDAEFFLNWIDRLEAAIRQRDRVPSDTLRTHMLGQLNEARRVYREIAARD